MAKSNEIEVMLIRSAQTEWDEAGRLQGRTDLPLSENASSAFAARAAGLAESGGAVPAVVHCGQDEASVQTARLLASVFGGMPVKVRPVATLGAIDLGLWQGLLAGEIEQRYPRRFRGWQDDPASVAIPEGEVFQDGQARLLTALAKLAEKAGPSPLAVVLRPLEHAVVLAMIEGRPPEDVPRLLEDTPDIDRRVIARDTFRDLLGSIKAVA